MEIRKLENWDLEEYILLRIKMLNENINKQYDNNKLIAVSGIEIIKRLPTPEINNINSTIGYICGVYTSKDYRKQGISKKLVGKTLEYGKNIGITRFKLTAHNPIAIKIYESFGFTHNENTMTLNL